MEKNRLKQKLLVILLGFSSLTVYSQEYFSRIGMEGVDLIGSITFGMIVKNTFSRKLRILFFLFLRPEVALIMPGKFIVMNIPMNNMLQNKSLGGRFMMQKLFNYYQK